MQCNLDSILNWKLRFSYRSEVVRYANLFGMCSFWNVLFLECALFIMCGFWNELFLENAQNGRHPFGMCSFWNVLFLECALFGMSHFWKVPFLESVPFRMDLFGMCSFCNIPFWECALFSFNEMRPIIKKIISFYLYVILKGINSALLHAEQQHWQAFTCGMHSIPGDIHKLSFIHS